MKQAERFKQPEFLVVPIDGLDINSDMSEVELIEAVENAMDNLYADLVEDEPIDDFDLAHYIKNPVKVMRIKARLTQKELAALMDCSQANISQIEKKDTVSAETIRRVEMAIL